MKILISLFQKQNNTTYMIIIVFPKYYGFGNLALKNKNCRHLKMLQSRNLTLYYIIDLILVCIK